MHICTGVKKNQPKITALVLNNLTKHYSSSVRKLKQTLLHWDKKNNNYKNTSINLVLFQYADHLEI